MSNLSVQANHYTALDGLDRDDWNTVSIGGQERSLKTAEDVELLVQDIEQGRIDGLSGADVAIDGHRVTINGQTYDLEKATETARFAADLRDGRLDGVGVGSADLYLDQDPVNGNSIVLDGKRYKLNSEKDVHKLLSALGGGAVDGNGAAADARWLVESKMITVGSTSYDLESVKGRRAMALDLADGMLDGASPVDPSAVGQGQAATSASSSAVDANGYPTLSPDHEDYEKAWTAWMETHTYEEFKAAKDAGAIEDLTKLFAFGEFTFALKDKGEESSRCWEVLSFMQRNKQQIFEHISRGFV